MRLTALFEAWHLGDGNYPPLHKRQLVNLSFEMLPYSISTDFPEEASRFEPVKDAEYRFVGEVLRVYRSPDGDPIVIIHAGDFRFFINWFPKDVPSLEESDRVVGYGRLLLDHYIWVEYLSRYQDPPDLFYPLK